MTQIKRITVPPESSAKALAFFSKLNELKAEHKRITLKNMERIIKKLKKND